MQTNAVANSKFQVARAVPFFVIENHPKFVEFMTHYYKWFNSKGPGASFESIKSQNDIDTADDVAKFFLSFGKGIPQETTSNKRWFVRFLKEFYSVKGTNASFDFFTRAVFGQSATVFYPKNQVLKCSGAQWNTQITMAVYSTNGDELWDLAGQVVSYPGFSLQVDEVYRKENYWILTLDYLTGEPSMLGTEYDFCGHIVEVLPQYGIMKLEGKGYEVGDLLVFPQVTIQITRTVDGKVQNLTINNGGTGYAVKDKITATTETRGYGFEAEVSEVDANGAITAIKMIRGGNGYDRDNLVFHVTSNFGSGAEFLPVWNADFKDIKEAQIVRNTIWGEKNMEVTAKTTDVNLILEMRAVHQMAYGERASCSPSSLSAFTTDLDYYQNHSYEVRSNADLQDVESSLKELLHIAGMKMFIHSSVEYDLDVGFEAYPEDIPKEDKEIDKEADNL